MSKRVIVLIISASAALAAVLLVAVSRQFPETVSRLYTQRIFKYITLPLKFIANLVPFSLGELALFILIAVSLVALVRAVRSVYRRRSGLPLVKYFTNVLIVLCVAVFCFVTFGGLNYSGLTFAETAGYDLQGGTVEELKEMCLFFAGEATQQRAKLSVNDDGVVVSDLSLYEILEQAQDGYDVLAKRYTWLDGYFVRPKLALASRVMSYLQISGIYPYIVPEALVNADAPIMTLPHTVCHEMAHQRGFAREDEANYIAYLAAISNDEPLFKYSGYLEAFIYSMNALYSADAASWREVMSSVHQGLWLDIRYISDVWNSYSTPGDVIGSISSGVNDVFLQVNDVEDGVQSYGRVVDLLLAEWRLTRE